MANGMTSGVPASGGGNRCRKKIKENHGCTGVVSGRCEGRQDRAVLSEEWPGKEGVEQVVADGLEDPACGHGRMPR